MPTTLDPPATTVTTGAGPVAVTTGLVLIGSVVAVDPWGLAPFGPLRWAVVTVTLLLAVLASRGPVELPRPMIVAWAVLLVAMTAATVTAVDPVHAWIGTPDRRLGLLSWVGFAAAWVVGSTIRTPSQQRWVSRSSCLAGGLLALGAGLDVLGWLPASGFVTRLGGTYGQPAYLAAMATLLIPVAIGVAADAVAPRAWRLTGGLAALGSTAALLASDTRGAWLGLGAGALPLLVRAARPARDRLRPGDRPLTRVLVVVALALLAIVVVVPAAGVTSRAASGLDLSQGTAAGRLAEWRVASRVIAAHPWLGVGPEGYRIAFPAAADVDYGRTYGREVHPDRAHNSLLDVTATGGLGAGAAWLALLLGVVALGLRGARSDDPVQIGAGVAVIAYAAQQQVLFPLAEIDPVWWLLVGMLCGRRGGSRGPDPAAVDDRSAAPRRGWAFLPTSRREPPSTGIAGLGTAARVIALALLGATLVAGALGVLADRRMARAVDLARPPTTQAALVLADAATSLRPDDIRLWFAASRIALRGDRIVDVDAALDRLERGLAVSPRDPALRVEQAALLLERARRSQLPDDQDAAIIAHRALVADDPANVGPRIGLATALAYAGQHHQAALVADQAQGLDPDAAGLAALRGLLNLLESPQAAPTDATGGAEEDR